MASSSSSASVRPSRPSEWARCRIYAGRRAPKVKRSSGEVAKSRGEEGKRQMVGRTTAATGKATSIGAAHVGIRVLCPSATLKVSMVASSVQTTSASASDQYLLHGVPKQALPLAHVLGRPPRHQRRLKLRFPASHRAPHLATHSAGPRHASSRLRAVAEGCRGQLRAHGGSRCFSSRPSSYYRYW